MAETNKIELQPFNLTLDLTDLSLDRPQGGGRKWNTMPEGRYKVRINDCGVYTGKEGKQSVRFTVEITEGEYAGSLTDVYCGLKIDEVGTRLGWKRALASIGAPPEALEQRELAVNSEMFKNQDAFVSVEVNTKRPQDDKGNPNFNRNFITLAEYEAAPGPKAEAGAGQTAAPVTMQAPAQAATTPRWQVKGAPVAAPAAAAAPAVNMSVPKPKVGAAAMYGSMIGK